VPAEVMLFCRLISACLRRFELVTDLPDGVNIHGIMRVWLDLVSQSGYESVYAA